MLASHEPQDNLRALANYAKPWRRTAVPPMRMAAGSVLNTATNALFPWMASDEYPGRIRGMVALFQGRVTKWAIREWRRG